MKTLLLTLFAIALTLAAVPAEAQLNGIPKRNQQVIDTVVRYGASISPTYHDAVCTELVIGVLKKFYPLSKTDRRRIRIVTSKDVHSLLDQNSPIPKGVCYALTAKGVGDEVGKLSDVLPGDFVQFWTATWGHCGIVKEVDLKRNTMVLYSSFPSTDGYGLVEFDIPKRCFFVRLK